MKFILPIAGMQKRRALKFGHKKTVNDPTRQQLEKHILGNILFADNSRNGGK
ncbi:hypothetical protein LABALGNA3A7_09470 [Dellaglioa algida]|nr:hypothetical protein LABALGNA3A7_09470 [Dellaglioa algida]